MKEKVHISTTQTTYAEPVIRGKKEKNGEQIENSVSYLFSFKETPTRYEFQSLIADAEVHVEAWLILSNATVRIFTTLC